MADTQTLAALLSRVESGEGEDRELSRDVYEALTGECVHRETRYVELENDERELECVTCGADTYGEERRWSGLTSSLDAVRALVDRLLPGWGRKIYYERAHGDGKMWGWAVLSKEPGSVARTTGKARTEPRALLGAALITLALTWGTP